MYICVSDLYSDDTLNKDIPLVLLKPKAETSYQISTNIEGFTHRDVSLEQTPLKVRYYIYSDSVHMLYYTYIIFGQCCQWAMVCYHREMLEACLIGVIT